MVRMRRGVIDLANVHLGGRADDIDLDVWSVLGMAQPAQHPRILEEERTSDIGCESWGDVREELTMSVLSTSLAVAIRPSEKEGSAVLSMRTIAIFARPSEVSGDSDEGLREPSKATLWVAGSRCMSRVHRMQLDSGDLHAGRWAHPRSILARTQIGRVQSPCLKDAFVLSARRVYPTHAYCMRKLRYCISALLRHTSSSRLVRELAVVTTLQLPPL